MLATQQQILHIIKFINLLQKLNKTEKGESNNCTWSKFLPTCREKRSKKLLVSPIKQTVQDKD